MPMISDAYVLSLRNQLARTHDEELPTGTFENTPSENLANDHDLMTHEMTADKDACFKVAILVRVLNEPQSSITVLCAEPGMGKTEILTHAVTKEGQAGMSVRYEDLQDVGHDASYRKLREIARWCSKHAKSRERVFIAVDNLMVGDEIDVERKARCIRQCKDVGAKVLVAMLPEGEPLAEQLYEATKFWSCDLRLACPGHAEERRLYETYTQGVPLLAMGLGRVDEDSRSAVVTHASYLEPFVHVVSKSFRPNMMNEERCLRSAMMLLGSGSISELGYILGDIQEDVWLALARDGVLFGIDGIGGTFRCAGACTTDGLSAAYRTLSAAVASCPALVVRAASVLAGRGEYARSAVVSELCSNSAMRVSVTLDWACEYINAGQVEIVIKAIACAHDEGLEGTRGYMAALAVLDSLGKNVPGTKTPQGPGLDATTRTGRIALLAQTCRAQLRGVAYAQGEQELLSNDELTNTLITHVNAMKLVAQGRIDKAYALLVTSSARYKTNSVACSLVSIDYMLCSLLMGIVPSSADVDAFRNTGEFLERSELSLLRGIHSVVLPVGQLLAGRRGETSMLDMRIQRADRLGDKFLQGLLLLASAISDVRIKAYARGHVRLSLAMRLLEKAGTDALVKIARIVDLAIRVQLGERVPKSEVQSCRGVCKDLDHVIAIFLAALPAAAGNRHPVKARWGGTGCPGNVFCLVNTLAADCGDFSRRFRELMPETWRESSSRACSETDLFFESLYLAWQADNDVPLLKGSTDAGRQLLDGSAHIELYMLGGFEVRVDGLPIKSASLERRRAKSVLALLAAVPGHAAQRYVIMESIWPSYDFDSANKCVYSATSVLRQELGSSLAHEEGTTLVVSNKVEGTLALNPELIRCDIDLFSARARAALDSNDDRQTVEYCREAEEIYRGDLFVSPHDADGILSARARELRTLFADAMIAGSTAAKNLKMRLLACRWARKAHEIDEMREDAIRTLVAALCLAGRQVEAESTYEKYVSRVIEVTRRPPSRRLRESIEELLERDGSEPFGGRDEHMARRERFAIVGSTDSNAPGQLEIDFEKLDDDTAHEGRERKKVV